MYIKYKSERGSMAVYVTVVLLTMLIILSSLYMTTSSVRKSQLTAAVMIKKAYESDNNNAERIYNSLTGGGSSGGQEEPEEPEIEYVTDGLLLYYDAINNTGTGHSDTTTTWKDLSGNGNDGTISGATWHDNYLSFDGIDDIVSSIKNVEFNSSKELTIEFVGQNRNTSGTKIIMELSENSNKSDCAFYIDTGEYGTRDITLAMKYQYCSKVNHKMVNNIFDSTISSYTVQFNSTKPYDTYISMYKNGIQQQIQEVATSDLSNITLQDHKLYIGARAEGNEYASNMNIMSVRIYNRELTQEEVTKNNNIDRERFKQNTSYVTDGLILHYDAINNTGTGHSSTTTTWMDLSGNGNNGTFSTAPTTSTFYWEENCITLSNNSSSLSSYVDTPVNLNGKERTIIYTVDANGLTGSIWGDTDNKNMNGLFNYQGFIANRGTSSNNQARYDFNFNRAGIYTYAVTLSSSQLQFYQNGSLVTTKNNAIGLTTNNNIRLLAARYSSQNARNLKMYNFMIYDRVLSGNEIQNNYEIIKSEYGF